jgi:hypothetical protein
MSKIKTYKGFDSNLQCRGFQYKVGETYTTEENIELCENGFHAIAEDQSPLSVFSYYPPVTDGKPSRYCEVEADGEIKSDGDKICCSQLTVGAEIGIPGIVKAHIEWIKKHINNENNTDKKGKPVTAGSYGAATAGSYGAATAGYRGAATAGYRGAATAGDSGAATAGYSGAATAGSYGAATAGYRGAATAGDSGAATSRGQSDVGENGVAVARGNGVKVKGGLGSLLVCAIENDDNNNIKEWKSAIVDGEVIKADTWYTVKDGEFVEVTE